jgi:hypothetical protein
MFSVIVRVNTYYFPKQHYQNDICNGSMLNFIFNGDCIFKG